MGQAFRDAVFERIRDIGIDLIDGMFVDPVCRIDRSFIERIVTAVCYIFLKGAASAVSVGIIRFDEAAGNVVVIKPRNELFQRLYRKAVGPNHFPVCQTVLTVKGDKAVGRQFPQLFQTPLDQIRGSAGCDKYLDSFTF